MEHNLVKEKNQTADTEKIGVFGKFFHQCKVGGLLKASGICKTKGASPLTIFTIVFNLAFTGKNLFQGVSRNKNVGLGKDAVYNFLNSPTYNWRRFILLLSNRIYVRIRSLLDDSSEEVLIFDDSLCDRSRSKKVELLSRVFDHNSGKYLKGFRMLTLGWSDGNSFLGLDFALLSSSKKSNRYNGITKSLDKRTCGYKRRAEAMTKSTELMEPMLKRALAAGVGARYLLMDSWFSAPSDQIPRAIHYDHVFLYRGKPIRDIKVGLKTGCKGAGIEYGRFIDGGFVFHDLRHTFVNNLRKAGVPELVIMKITGHKTRECSTDTIPWMPLTKNPPSTH